MALYEIFHVSVNVTLSDLFSLINVEFLSNVTQRNMVRSFILYDNYYLLTLYYQLYQHCVCTIIQVFKILLNTFISNKIHDPISIVRFLVLLSWQSSVSCKYILLLILLQRTHKRLIFNLTKDRNILVIFMLLSFQDKINMINLSLFVHIKQKHWNIQKL